MVTERQISPEWNFWKDRFHQSRHYPQLEEDLEVDVAIVGAGISGLTCALELLNRGAKVCILEKNRIGHGSTGRSSAHLSTVWDGRYSDLLSQKGEEAPIYMAEALNSAIDRIEEISKFAEDQADFQRVPGYFICSHKSSMHRFDNEFSVLKNLGFSVEWLQKGNSPADQIQHEKAFRIEGQALFHPLKYISALAEKVTEKGGLIFENSRVKAFSPEIQTKMADVRYRDLVLATHTPLGVNVVQSALSCYRSFLGVFQTDTSWPPGLYWDTSQPYYYLRPLNEDGRLLLIGGKDKPVGYEGSANSFQDLQVFAEQKLGA
ncbi:MAG: FAD-binding oxidoreductase, partial [Bdellovibrionales bacterium]|nr:FAD-binding oxidoreductase [Bdellovibrionales bacterium]